MSKLKVDTRVTVETPEGVDFQFLIAGAGKRAVSWVLDLLLKILIAIIVIVLVYLLFGAWGLSFGTATGLVFMLWFFMSWLYGACFEAFWNGQTPGKRMQNLRVVRTNGTPIGWFEAFGRNLLLVADGLLYFPSLPLAMGGQTPPFPLNTAGLVTMACNRRMQRLGDLAFDTMVVDESREFITRTPGVTHGVDIIPRSQCSGRFHVPERTLAVIERLVEGDRLISDGRREEIARPLAEELRDRLGYEDLPPDPRNPNTYFVNSPVTNTLFLKRVLKTFSDDPEDAAARKRQEEERLSQDPGRYDTAETLTAADLNIDQIVDPAAVPLGSPGGDGGPASPPAPQPTSPINAPSTLPPPVADLPGPTTEQTDSPRGDSGSTEVSS